MNRCCRNLIYWKFYRLNKLDDIYDLSSSYNFGPFVLTPKCENVKYMEKKVHYFRTNINTFFVPLRIKKL